MPEETQNTAAAAGQEPGAAGDAAKAPAQDAGKDAGNKGAMSLEDAMNALKETRAEAAKYRTENKAIAQQFEQLKTGLSAALGIKTDEATPDALQKQFAQLKAELNGERVKSAFASVAEKQQANARLTFAFIKGEGMLDGLDPSADGFERELSRLVEKVLKENPELKVKPAVTRQGADFAKPGADGKVDMNARLRALALRGRVNAGQ